MDCLVTPWLVSLVARAWSVSRALLLLRPWRASLKVLEKRLEVHVRGDTYGFDQGAWKEALQLRDQVLCWRHGEGGRELAGAQNQA